MSMWGRRKDVGRLLFPERENVQKREERSSGGAKNILEEISAGGRSLAIILLAYSALERGKDGSTSGRASQAPWIHERVSPEIFTPASNLFLTANVNY